jgi:ribonuclease HII
MQYPPFDWKTLRPQPVIGVDEVGRGCLAGPVYAAACVLQSDLHVEHLTDSKLISESRREKLSPLIQSAHSVCIASATVEEIDELNILWAAMLAMQRAVLDLTQSLSLKEAVILVDGNTRIPDLPERFQQITLVKGDLRASPISAASIVAKVARDQRMKELGREFPAYGFEKHKGYASAIHRKAIAEKGPTIWHRRSFSGVKEYL